MRGWAAASAAPGTWPAILLGACALYWLAFGVHPPVTKVVFEQLPAFVVWRSATVLHLRWPLAATGPVLSVLCWHRTRKHTMLRPLALLPFAGVAGLTADLAPVAATANMLFFIPVLAFSLCALLAATSLPGGGLSLRHAGSALFVVSVALYTASGLYLARVVGDNIGDECHYLVQTASLAKDGDLDLRNNWPVFRPGIHERDVTRRSAGMHISPYSRGERCYSWHGFGLPLLLAPAWAIDERLIYLVLALLGGAANLGAFVLCRQAGAGPGWSVIAVAGMAFGFYWTVYSSRALVEVPAAAIAVWLVWAIAAQNRRPLRSAVVAGVAVPLLALLHIRFLPLGVTGAAAFVVSGLLPPYRGKTVRRLAGFAGVCAAGFLFYAWTQNRMYDWARSLHDGSASMLRNWLAPWGALADTMGLLSVFPLFLWLFPAALALFFRRDERESRVIAITGLALFVVNWLISCSNSFCVGPGGVPGRYLVVAMPLLLPGAARMLERTNRPARWWFFALCATHAVLAFVVYTSLPSLGRGMVIPFHSLAAQYPWAVGLFHPYAQFFGPAPSAARTASSLFVASAFGLSALAMLLPARRARLAAGAVVLLTAVGFAVDSWFPPATVADPRVLVARHLARIDRTRMRVASHYEDYGAHAIADSRSGGGTRPAGGAIPGPPVNLFDVSCLDLHNSATLESGLSVTTRDLGARMRGQVVSQPRVEVNDWEGRDLRWATLTPPQHRIPGAQALYLEAERKGDARVFFALREGERTLFEGDLVPFAGRIAETFLFDWRGGGRHLYVLVRLEGEDTDLRIRKLQWSPYGEALTRGTGLCLPGNVRPLKRKR